MNTYIGIDVHSKTFTAVAVDAQGKVKNKGQFPTTEANVLSFFKNVNGKKFVALRRQFSLSGFSFSCETRQKI